ncbi:MAG: RnfH family protein [Nevskiaceae bacterium]|nr:MAG: RnfH family protein [Nevskiaceae bacterium]
MLRVEVVYALPQRQTLLAVEVPAGATLREAILRSGLLEQHPELELATLTVGVFGQRATLARPLAAGDRVEIYRPLRADPKAARRARVTRRR